jgi:hypothetical protein
VQIKMEGFIGRLLEMKQQLVKTPEEKEMREW